MIIHACKIRFCKLPLRTYTKLNKRGAFVLLNIDHDLRQINAKKNEIHVIY